MYGYKVTFKGLPETVFACATSVDNYEWSNHNDKNTLEISLSEVEQMVVQMGDERLEYTDVIRLSCVVGDEPRYASAPAGARCDILTVAVRFEDLRKEGRELYKEDANDHSCYLLPGSLADVSEKPVIRRLLNTYIHNHVSGTAYDRAQCISLWFELLSVMDKATRRVLVEQKSSSENYYVKKLNYIIEKDYAQKLSLAQIAEEFDVSLSYLSSVYSTATGETFSKALLRTRMAKAKALIDEQVFSCEEIATKVGVCDATYLRKRFKKFYGVSISEYRNISNGLTLYHEKPIRKEKNDA